MRPATGQNPSDPALAPGKHSIESDSPSSTNLGSDLADVVGTPLIAGITESEPHTEPTKGEKAGREGSEQAAVEPGQSEPERGPTPDKPSLKRKLDLPDKVIRCAIPHVVLSCPNSPPISATSSTTLSCSLLVTQSLRRCRERGCHSGGICTTIKERYVFSLTIAGRVSTQKLPQMQITDNRIQSWNSLHG